MVFVLIPGFPGHEINPRGQVRNRKTKRILKPQYKAGYARVSLCWNGREQYQKVARLLLTAFVRPPRPGEQSRHLDDNRGNDALLNLAWGTQRDNEADRERNGLKKRGAAAGGRLTDEQARTVKTIRALGQRGLLKRWCRENGVYYPSAKAVSKGITYRHIT